MIKPLINEMPVSFSQLRKVVAEAKIKEESDLNIIADNLAETAPICKNEQELRDYIRTAKITRKLTHLVVHCTATQPNATITAIRNYWKNTLGWKNVGYHVILPQEGFTALANFNIITNGASGYNSVGVHISYVGGIDVNGKAKDTRTSSQKRLIEVFIEEMVKRFPKLKVIGHNEVANKACPSFQVKKEYSKFWTGK